MTSDWGTHDILRDALVSRVCFLRPDPAFPQHEQTTFFHSDFPVSWGLDRAAGPWKITSLSQCTGLLGGDCKFVVEAEGWCRLQAAFEPQADTQYSPGAFPPAS